MSGKIEISRELAERVVGWYDGGYDGTLIDEVAELRALLAAPVVERKPPIAYMRNEGTPDNLVKCTFTCPGAFGVYREPPAPVSVVQELRNMVGMFHHKAVTPLELETIRNAQACLDKVKEMNQ